MAAENELQLVAPDATVAGRVAELVIADVTRIESKYSRYRDDSVTTRINHAAGGAAVTIDAETAALFQYAERCYALSGGLFDITSGVLRRVWDFKRNPPQLPNAAALAAVVTLIDWSAVEWNEQTVRLPRAQMEIDFGGIGKEYAADRAATICVDAGVRNGFVNLAGDVRAFGAQEHGAPWRVGIRHPRQSGVTIAYVELRDAAVATSGDYERFFDLDGRRYCHILNPRTGMPADYWQSVSVLAPLCVVAGGCSTIAMLLEKRGEAFLRRQKVDYLAIGPDGAVCGTNTSIARNHEASAFSTPIY